jgi:hypothetical protein
MAVVRELETYGLRGKASDINPLKTKINLHTP